MTGFDDKLAALRARFVAAAPAQAAELREAIATGDLAHGRMIAHGLAGRSGMFGFGELGGCALAADEAPDQELALRLAALASALDEVAQEA